jgi:hypothetical protein
MGKLRGRIGSGRGGAGVQVIPAVQGQGRVSTCRIRPTYTELEQWRPLVILCMVPRGFNFCPSIVSSLLVAAMAMPTIVGRMIVI